MLYASCGTTSAAPGVSGSHLLTLTCRFVTGWNHARLARICLPSNPSNSDPPGRAYRRRGPATGQSPAAGGHCRRSPRRHYHGRRLVGRRPPLVSGRVREALTTLVRSVYRPVRPTPTGLGRDDPSALRRAPAAVAPPRVRNHLRDSHTQSAVRSGAVRPGLEVIPPLANLVSNGLRGGVDSP